MGRETGKIRAYAPPKLWFKKNGWRAWDVGTNLLAELRIGTCVVQVVVSAAGFRATHRRSAAIETDSQKCMDLSDPIRALASFRPGQDLRTPPVDSVGSSIPPL